MENNTMNQSLMVSEDNGFIMELTSARKTQFSSVDITKLKDEDKAKFFNAINSTDKRLSEQANLVLNIKDVFVEEIECIQEETGEIQKCARTVLIDDKGEGYQAVSSGVFSSLKKIFAIFGVPATWKKPLPLKVKIITKGNKKITTLEIA